jgi:hypothetical protein
MLLLAVVLAVAGTILLVFQRSEAIAGTMVAAAIGMLAREVQVAKQKAAKSEERVVDLEATATTLRKQLDKDQ